MRLAPSARDLAMVFQSYALYPHLTVEQNLLVPLRMRSLTRVQRLPWIGPAFARARAARARRRGAATSPPRSGSSHCSSANPVRCPAGSASASRSGERWCAGRSPS